MDFQGLSATPLQTTVHALRLIDDQHGSRGPDQVDRFLTTSLFTVFVEVVDVLLVNRANRYHHDLYQRAAGEIPHLPQFRGIVEEIFERRTRV